MSWTDAIRPGFSSKAIKNVLKYKLNSTDSFCDKKNQQKISICFSEQITLHIKVNGAKVLES